MTLSDRDNPYARPTAWTVSKPQPTRAEPEPEAAKVEPAPAKVDPPLKRNSIYSGSAIPMAPLPVAEPAPPPKPHPEIAPPGEARPPLRSVSFVAPARPARPRRSFGRFVPLIGSLATAAAGFALMAFVLSRPAPQLDVGPPHRPTHLAVSRADQTAPQLRGALQRLGLAPRRATRSAPAAARVQPVSTAPVEVAPAPVAASAQKPAAPRYTPPPAPDPDAPMATRPPYS